MNKIKFFTLISVLCLAIIIPTSFAADVELAIEGDVEVENITSTSDSLNILTSDYYFDANVGDDTGNGSISSPYKEFKSSRVVSNSNLYLANGEYVLDRQVSSIKNVTIIGENPSQTILRYYGTGFTVSSSLTLKNLTLINLRISNNGNITAFNTIFKDDQSASNNGGAIESQSASSYIVLDNCTFNNTSAKYGGAIYLKQGTLTISNSLFINTHASSYGGAIYIDNKGKTYIDDSRFMNSYSVEDAGGAIYLINSDLMAKNLEISNCSAIFGGAITSLKSNLVLNNFTGRNNRAKYDGGAIYSMFQKFNMSNSLFENNSAENAGAIYVYNVDDFLIKYTQFISNHAINRAGAFYSAYLWEPYYDSILDEALHNAFLNNNASSYSDVLEVYVPTLFIESGDYQLYRANFSEITDIPSYYDLRQLGQVTSVKNQGSNGNCWAFSSLGALESAILKATGIELDLSEENMKNLMGSYSVYGWKYSTNNGGNDEMSQAYLLSWLGALNESDDTYRINTLLSPVLDSIVHVQNILFLKRNNYTDNDGIKMAIMKYGGVETSLYMDARSSPYKQYYTGNSDPDHAAVIVGWDDDMVISGAPGNGAWIVKNSWGASWGDKGFFYVSYYDTKFAEVGSYNSYAFVLNDSIKYDKNYQYDIPGRTDIFINSSNVVWYKNRFTATDDEYLAAVSTYFREDSSWELSIYVNGKLKHTQSGFAVPGYKTIDLSQFVQLKKDDVFEVEFKITVDGEATFYISEIVRFSTQFFSKNNSFVSYDGINWKDLCDLEWDYVSPVYGSHTYASQAACIKAFTVLNIINTSLELEVVESSTLAQFKAIIKNQYGNLVSSGKVNFTVDGENIVVDVVNGIASLTHLYDTIGSKTITAKFSAIGFADSSDSVDFDLRYYTELTANNVTTTYGIGKNVIATLKDLNGAAIPGVNVNIVLGSINKTAKTSSRGRISVSTVDLIPGVYTALISFAGNDIYAPSTTTVNVVVDKASTVLTADDVVIVGNATGVAVTTLTDAYGNVLSGIKVKIVVGDLSKIARTDVNGQVSLDISSLAPGEYKISARSAETDIYKEAKASASAVVYADKLDTVLTIPDVVAVCNTSGAVVVATLKDDFGNVVSDVKVKVVVGGLSKIARTDVNGQVSLDISSLAPGEYKISARSGITDIYNEAKTTASAVVYADKLDTVLTIPDVVAVCNTSGAVVVATLKDDFGNVVSDVKVKVVVGGLSKIARTDVNGQVSLDISSLAPGEYKISARSAVTDIYNEAKASASAVVYADKLDTVLTIPDVVAVYNASGAVVVATLKDDFGNVVSDVKVKVVVGGLSKIARTDVNGQVSLDISSLAPGEYKISARSGVTDIYKEAKATANAIISQDKIATTLAIPDVEIQQGTPGTAVATLKDEFGNVVSGVKVKIVVGSLSKIAKTDNNGQISIDISSLAPGEYKISARSAVTDVYDEAKASAQAIILAV